MKIEVLGMGCSKCVKLYENVQQAVTEAGVQAEVLKISDMDAILDCGVMLTPALMIDGEVKLAGKVPSVDEIKLMLTLESTSE